MSSRRSDAERTPTRGRRGARRLALQALYQWLMSNDESPGLVAEFVSERATPGVDEEYFRWLLGACMKDAEALDSLLAPALDRAPAELDPVEHAILMIGAAELKERSELAVSIVINEAVELAKTFGSDGGHRYVNGVLDQLAGRLRASEGPGRGSRARG